MREKKEHTMNLMFDNLAIPEVHIKGANTQTQTEDEDETVTYEDVAIPEIHIQRRKELFEQIVKLRKRLHTIPETSGNEEKTKHMLMEFLKKNTSFTVVDSGTWFYAVKKAQGEAQKQPIAFRADMDAVSDGNGTVSHLCGHDGHCSIVCGVALYLSKREEALHRDVYLLFQPAEEIGEGAKLCRTLLAEKNITEIYGLHNIPGYPLGEVLVRKGTFACASTGLSIRLTGKTCHAACPENGRNPAMAFAKYMLMIQEVMKEFTKNDTCANMTVVGLELGSDKYGVSASDGILRLTVRASTVEHFQAMLLVLKNFAMQLAQQEKLEIRIEEIERFPSTENSAASVDKIIACAGEKGFSVTELAEPMRWSEDFGYYLQTCQGAYFGIGAGEGHAGLHTAGYEFPDEIIKTAAAMLVALIEK